MEAMDLKMLLQTVPMEIMEVAMALPMAMENNFDKIIF